MAYLINEAHRKCPEGSQGFVPQNFDLKFFIQSISQIPKGNLDSSMTFLILKQNKTKPRYQDICTEDREQLVGGRFLSPPPHTISGY